MAEIPLHGAVRPIRRAVPPICPRSTRRAQTDPASDRLTHAQEHRSRAEPVAHSRSLSCLAASPGSGRSESRHLSVSCRRQPCTRIGSQTSQACEGSALRGFKSHRHRSVTSGNAGTGPGSCRRLTALVPVSVPVGSPPRLAARRHHASVPRSPRPQQYVDPRRDAASNGVDRVGVDDCRTAAEGAPAPWPHSRGRLSSSIRALAARGARRSRTRAGGRSASARGVRCQSRAQPAWAGRRRGPSLRPSTNAR